MINKIHTSTGLFTATSKESTENNLKKEKVITYYDEKKTKIREIYFANKDGKRHGASQNFNESGEPRCEVLYTNGYGQIINSAEEKLEAIKRMLNEHNGENGINNK